MRALAIPKARVVRQRQPRITAGSHLAWVRTLPCIIRGVRAGVQAAHIRFADARYGKRAVGAGERPDDRWVVPLHHELHLNSDEAQHTMSERAFWARYGINVCVVALALWGCSGNDDLAEDILQRARLA